MPLSLSSQNPWWTNPRAIDSDRYVLTFQRCPVHWVPRLRYFFDLETDGVYTLRGPRQVGKTTLVKLIVKSLLERGVPPRRIFYWTCDLVEGPKELVTILEEYLGSTRNQTKERLFIFLDEISAVRDWQRGIKYLYDIGKLANSTVIMTGSHSLDIRRAAERLPGRRGRVTGVLDKILVPMKFVEYAETRNKDIKRLFDVLNLIALENRKSILLELAKGNIPSQIRELVLHSEVLSRLFDDYMLTGGIIRALTDYLSKDGRILPETFSTYVRVTIGDILRWEKKETYLAQLLRRIIETLTTQVSWRGLQKSTDIGHPNTVAEYVDVLQSSFVLSTIYALDRNKGGPRYEKAKKIHFLDPFIFHALRGWVNQIPSYEEALRFLDSSDKAKLVECVVCDHLIRLAFNLNPTSDFEPSRNVLYWKSKLHEVDYVLKFKGEYLPIEVKYASSVSRSDLNGIFSFIRTQSPYRGIVVTKDHLAVEKGVVTIPAHIFLSLI